MSLHLVVAVIGLESFILAPFTSYGLQRASNLTSATRFLPSSYFDLSVCWVGKYFETLQRTGYW